MHTLYRYNIKPKYMNNNNNNNLYILNEKKRHKAKLETQTTEHFVCF